MVKELMYQINFLESDPSEPMDVIRVRLDEKDIRAFAVDLKNALEKDYGDEVDDRITWVNDQIDLVADRYGALWNGVAMSGIFFVK